MRSPLLQLSKWITCPNELKSENPLHTTQSVTKFYRCEPEKRNQRSETITARSRSNTVDTPTEHEMAERTKWDEKADKERKEHGSQYSG